MTDSHTLPGTPLFITTLRYPSRGFPLVDRGCTAELVDRGCVAESERQCRQGPCLVLRMPLTRRALVIGIWRQSAYRSLDRFHDVSIPDQWDYRTQHLEDYLEPVQEEIARRDDVSAQKGTPEGSDTPHV